MNKILIIVCTAVVVLAIAVPSTILVMNSMDKGNEPRVAGGSMMSQIDADTTFAEYSKRFKDDVTDEQLVEAEDLFDQLQQAMSDEDNETTRSLMMQLNQLGLYDAETDGRSGDGQRPDGGQGQGRNQSEGQRPNN